jgi:hypothetical protein
VIAVSQFGEEIVGLGDCLSSWEGVESDSPMVRTCYRWWGRLNEGTLE